MVDLNIKLPDDFLDEEVRCGYTVTRQMKEVWAVELDLLVEFDRVCKKYDLKYFADGGTVLGAVRHNGFIPWDDDIDIGMDRESYIKICEHAGEFQYPYFFQTEETDHGCYRGHAQLRRTDTTAILKSQLEYKFAFNQGIFIDIFPFDKIPEDKNEQERFFNDLDVLKRKYGKINNCYIDVSKNKIKHCLKAIRKKLYLFFDSNKNCVTKQYNKYESLKTAYMNAKSRYGLNIQMTNFNNPKIIDISYFSREPKMEDFEFIKIPIPYNYDEYLHKAYGDYMTPVIGANCHGGVVFDTNKSYKNYLLEELKK